MVPNLRLQHRRLPARFAKQGVQSAASQAVIIIMIDDAFRCLTPEQQAKLEALCARDESKWFKASWNDDADTVSV